MATVTEIHESNSIDLSIDNDRRERKFYVELDDGQTADEAISVSGIPRIGDSHPRNAFLLAQRVTAERVINSANPIISQVTVYYYFGEYVAPNVRYLLEWDISPTEQYIDLDLDGRKIGEEYFYKKDQAGIKPVYYLDPPHMDDQAQIGTTILTSNITLRVKLLKPAFFNMAICVALKDHVNNSSWFGIPAGFGQYLGANATQVGKSEWEVVHNFRAGYTKVPDPAAPADPTKTKTYGLAYIMVPKFERVKNVPGGPGEVPTYKRQLVDWNAHRVYHSGDFKLLLGPLTP